VNAFADDLRRSELVTTLPESNVDAAFLCYNATLSTLLDKHAPLTMKRVTERRSARWYDSECRQMKRTRRLERQHRLRTDEAKSSWHEQFANQCRLFRDKFTKYWSEEIEACRNNPRQLWQRVDELLQAPQQNASAKLTAGEFADFLRSTP